MSILGHLRALYTSTQCGLAEFNLVTGVLQIWSSPDKSVPCPPILESLLSTTDARLLGAAQAVSVVVVCSSNLRFREEGGAMNMPGQVD